MATSQVIATVVAVIEPAFARDSEGNMRPLKAGDVLHEGEIVITAAGGRVELANLEGALIGIDENQAVAITAELSEETRPQAADAALVDGTIEQVLQALNDGASLDDVLEAPAAGLAGGGGGEGNSFVRLLRITEDVDSLALDFDGTSREDVVLQEGQSAVLAESVPTPPPVITHVGNAAGFDSVTVAEGQAAVFTVRLSAASPNAETYTLSLTSGTATLGADFTDALTFSNGVVLNGDGTITVPAGVTSFTVTVPTVDDALVENTEAFTLTVGAVAGTGTILDNDINRPPVFGSPTRTASVSEEGLPGGNRDAVGSPGDQTDNVVATGTFAISDPDGHDVKVTLTAPTTTLTSNGQVLVWTGGGTSELKGSVGGKTILTVSITDTGAYTVTLSGQLDHPVKNVEDVLNLNVGVTATDSFGGATSGTLAVRIEDDSPVLDITKALVRNGAGGVVEGTLTDLGADLTGAKITFNPASLPSGLTSYGKPITYQVLGSKVIASADGVKVFELSADASDGTFRMEVYRSIDALTQSVSFAQAAGPGYRYVDRAGTFGTKEGSEWAIRISATSNGQPAGVNTNNQVMGVDNLHVQSGEKLFFEFDTKGIDLVKLADFGSAMQFKLTASQGHNTFTYDWTATYVDLATGQAQTVTHTGASGGTLSVQALDGTYLQSVSIAQASGSFQVASVQYSTSRTGVDPLKFGFTAVDGDGDTVSGDLSVAFKLTGALGGTDADDAVGGGAGADTIWGGAGNDILTGGLGADVFVWKLGDQSASGKPAALDTVTDFNVAQGDKLDLSDILKNHGTGTLDGYLQLIQNGSNTELHISTSGALASGQVDQTIVLQDFNTTLTLQDLINQQIIKVE